MHNAVALFAILQMLVGMEALGLRYHGHWRNGGLTYNAILWIAFPRTLVVIGSHELRLSQLLVGALMRAKALLDRAHLVGGVLGRVGIHARGAVLLFKV